jgi:hypothetical protein
LKRSCASVENLIKETMENGGLRTAKELTVNSEEIELKIHSKQCYDHYIGQTENSIVGFFDTTE